MGIQGELTTKSVKYRLIHKLKFSLTYTTNITNYKNSSICVCDLFKQHKISEHIPKSFYTKMDIYLTKTSSPSRTTTAKDFLR